MEWSIRPIEKSDSKGLNQLRRMPGVFENVLGTPAERVTTSEEYIDALGQNGYAFVAVTKDSYGQELIIGCGSLAVYAMPRVRHCAGIGIMVHTDYQNIGVGSQLMEAILDMTDNWLMLMRVELTVFADNARAIHLYEKYGFVAEGTRRKAAIRGGEYADELAMARLHPHM